MTIEKGKKNVYRIINRAIRQNKAAGVELKKSTWGLGVSEQMRYTLPQSCGCPLALVMCGKKVDLRCSDYESAAARILGKPRAWVRAFINGFDGDKFSEMGDKLKAHKDAFNFGRRLAKKHVESANA